MIYSCVNECALKEPVLQDGSWGATWAYVLNSDKLPFADETHIFWVFQNPHLYLNLGLPELTSTIQSEVTCIDKTRLSCINRSGLNWVNRSGLSKFESYIYIKGPDWKPGQEFCYKICLFSGTHFSFTLRVVSPGLQTIHWNSLFPLNSFSENFCSYLKVTFWDLIVHSI